MTTKRMSAGETQSLIALLKCDCHCEDNVDAEQEYDGSWRGSFSICTSCKAATALSALSADLEAARGAALEEAAKTCRDEMERARRLGAGRDAALIPNMDLVTAGREDSASRILAAIRAPEGAEAMSYDQEKANLVSDLVKANERWQAAEARAKRLEEALRVIVKIYNDDEDCSDRGVTAQSMAHFARAALSLPTKETT